MLARLFFLFLTVPLVELALLLWIGNRTSWPFTILLVIVTGIVGASLARQQGWRTYQRIQQEMAAGRMPTESLVDAAMIFVAGALLLTPGILTDVFGLSLLVPRCRRFYQRNVSNWLRVHVNVKTHEPRPSQGPTHHSDHVIDSYVVSSDDRESGE